MAKKYPCPRCRGTGDFALIGPNFDVAEVCKACGGTGRVTPQEWQSWCDSAYDGENFGLKDRRSREQSREQSHDEPTMKYPACGCCGYPADYTILLGGDSDDSYLYIPKRRVLDDFCHDDVKQVPFCWECMHGLEENFTATIRNLKIKAARKKAARKKSRPQARADETHR